jgi:ribosomal protein S7
MELNYEEHKIKQLFINILLKKGKKTNSEILFNIILIELKKKTKQKPLFILVKAINNLMPKLKIINIPNKKKSKKKNKVFLLFLEKEKQIKLSVIWLLKNTNLKKISTEIIETSKKKSKTIQQKKKYYHEIKKSKFNLLF